MNQPPTLVANPHLVSMSTSTCGRARRLARLFGRGATDVVLVPIDDSLLAGPTNGLESLGRQVPAIVEGKPNAIMGFAGTLRRFERELLGVPTILNLTASTTRVLHTRKTLVNSVETALALDCSAVAVHVNIGSEYETEMLAILGRVAADCDRLGMPLLGIMYPRRERDGRDDNFDELRRNNRREYAALVAHAARVGCEFGADFIKTQYTGDPESFSTVVEACDGVPVFVAGGPFAPANTVLAAAQDAFRAGAAGMSLGRNVFGRKSPAAMIGALRAVMGGGSSAQDAIREHPDCEAKHDEEANGR